MRSPIPWQNVYDLGSDPIAFHTDRLALAQSLLRSAANRTVASGEPWTRQLSAVSSFMRTALRAGAYASKYLGGFVFSKVRACFPQLVHSPSLSRPHRERQPRIAAAAAPPARRAGDPTVAHRIRRCSRPLLKTPRAPLPGAPRRPWGGRARRCGECGGAGQGVVTCAAAHLSRFLAARRAACESATQAGRLVRRNQRVLLG